MAQHADDVADDDWLGHRTDTGVAELLADDDRPGGWFLTLDRIAQSYVDLDDPAYLEFAYVQGFADAVDAVFPLPERLDVTHVGGGALTFPRYVLHTRPGSSQIVLEPDAALTALVRQRLPLPRRSGIRVRPDDGRSGIAALADSSADVIVLDAFAGGRVPAELTTVEALADSSRVLRPTGLFLANIADQPPLDYTRRLVAGARSVFRHVLLRTETSVRKRRFGNVVVVASNARLPTEQVLRRAQSAVEPITVVTGLDLVRLAETAKPWTDADRARSPRTPELTWRIGEPRG